MLKAILITRSNGHKTVHAVEELHQKAPDIVSLK